MPRADSSDWLERVAASVAGGEEVGETEAMTLLRSPRCPPAAVRRLAEGAWVRRSRRLLPLLVRHPECPRAFALEFTARLPWRELAAAASDPRTPPPVRRHAERKLLDRLRDLTLGERISLARLSPRAVVGALIVDASPRCIEALVDNPMFTEGDAVRLVVSNPNPECSRVLLGHRRWGRSRTVLVAAVRAARLPPGTLVGILPRLGRGDVWSIARSEGLPPIVRDAARRFLAGKV